METGTEHNKSKAQILPPTRPQSLRRWIIDQITILAEAFSQPMTSERLRIYAGDLEDIERSRLETGFSRARRELTFFPKIAELRALASGRPAEHQDAEARKAWDVLTSFVRKYVGNDVYGNYGPEHGWHPKNFPRLSDRILDTLRRTGGWKTYACMTEADFPFVQKRFFEEYQAWTAVEQVSSARLLTETPRHLLAAKRLEQAQPEVKKSTPEPPEFKARPIPEPLTDAQLRDRREMLRQQAESLTRK